MAFETVQYEVQTQVFLLSDTTKTGFVMGYLRGPDGSLTYIVNGTSLIGVFDTNLLTEAP